MNTILEVYFYNYLWPIFIKFWTEDIIFLFKSYLILINIKSFITLCYRNQLYFEIMYLWFKFIYSRMRGRFNWNHSMKSTPSTVFFNQLSITTLSLDFCRVTTERGHWDYLVSVHQRKFMWGEESCNNVHENGFSKNANMCRAASFKHYLERLQYPVENDREGIN